MPPRDNRQAPAKSAPAPASAPVLTRVEALSPAGVAAAADLLTHAPDRWGAAAVRAELENPASLALLGYAGGEAACFCAFTHAADEASLNNLVTAPAHRRRGAARALLTAAFSRLRALGVKTVYLEVRKNDPAPAALYMSLGFCAVGERKNFYGPGQDALIMKKELEADL